MTRKRRTTQNSKTVAPARKRADVLGYSSLTGTRVLRPAPAKGGTVSAAQVRAALRRLSQDARC